MFPSGSPEHRATGAAEPGLSHLRLLIVNLVSIAVAVVAGVVALVRWLRVSQREHYLPGACRRTAHRWIERRPPNLILAAMASLAAAGALAAALAQIDSITAAAVILAVVLAAIFPWPMTVLGREVRLKFTRRARTLAAIVLVLEVVLAVLGFMLGVGAAALALAVVATPLLVDLGASVAQPIERRLLERHRRLAETKLRQIDPFVIAVTGSWGKTSTKGHIRDLISGSAEVVASPASWNNTAGLARTINEHLGERTEVLVAEMGMYGPGEIRSLCAWVPPRIAVICAIGPMHLERVGSIEGIVAAKAEILESAEMAVLWVGEPRLAELARRTAVPQVWSVGPRGTEGARVEVGQEGDDLVVWADGDVVGAVPVASGVHAGNVGCAVAAALAYGIPAAVIARRLPSISNPAHRAVAGANDRGVTVIDDTFNANPAGALAAVNALQATVRGRRAVATPGMVELGDEQDERNEALAQAIVKSGATLLAIGWTNRDALRRGSSGQVVTVPSREAARDWVRANLGAGDGVLWENDLPDHYP